MNKHELDLRINIEDCAGLKPPSMARVHPREPKAAMVGAFSFTPHLGRSLGLLMESWDLEVFFNRHRIEKHL